jgi:hypothetical protein
MLGVVAPVLHKLPVAADEVSVTELPKHRIVEASVLIVGTLGVVVTDTEVGLLAAEVHIPLIA